MVGDEASQLRSMLECSYPMDNGIVRNWDDMMHVWDYTFGETKLNVNPKECKVTEKTWQSFVIRILKTKFCLCFVNCCYSRLMILSVHTFINLFNLQVLLTEPPLNPSKNREKMVEVSVFLNFKNSTRICFNLTFFCYFHLGKQIISILLNLAIDRWSW